MGSFLPLDFGGAISSMTFVFGGTLKGSCSVTSKVLFSKSTLRQRKNSQERINVFMEHLNNYLQNQGYENTILYDPSGYDVNALTTVSDLKSVSTHLLEKQWFRDIVSKSNYTATLPDGSTQTWRNTNTFLDQTSEYYNENVKGIKTGSLSNDYNLVVLYQQHGKEFLICSLGSQSDSSRYDDVNYILKTIDESDYLTK